MKTIRVHTKQGFCLNKKKKWNAHEGAEYSAHHE